MDLKNYKLVFEDDFNGSELDLEKWSHRGLGGRRCGFNSDDAVRVENGNLIIKYDYRDGKYGEGWYSGMIRANRQFCKGYFECRAICNDPLESKFWSAFWMQASDPYTAASRGGINGAELDILEAFRSPEGYPTAESNVHCAGYADGSESQGLRSQSVARRKLDTCYTEYHTYGLEWTDTEYRIFIDGECVGLSAWADGVSTVDEELIVSLELPGEKPADKSLTGEYIIDYVRVYQKED
ncbi:MAG: glycoside hydrolase family 16 protein [Clostridia bacterium]|nr:glycoside hydrolase family 16 protein [Clostridia bacterium]